MKINDLVTIEAFDNQGVYEVLITDITPCGIHGRFRSRPKHLRKWTRDKLTNCDGCFPWKDITKIVLKRKNNESCTN